MAWGEAAESKTLQDIRNHLRRKMRRILRTDVDGALNRLQAPLASPHTLPIRPFCSSFFLWMPMPQ